MFYDTDQSPVLYGVDLQSENRIDPVVMMAETGGDLEWDRWHATLSGFFMQDVFWQAVNGGMPQVGIGSIPNEQPLAVPEGWEGKMLDGDLQKALALFRDGQVLLVWGTYPWPDVSAGGRTKRDLRDIGQTFGVSWDYTTLSE